MAAQTERAAPVAGTEVSRLASRTLFRSLLAVVLLSPLPLACNRPWAWSLLSVAIGLLLGVWCVLVLSGRLRTPVPAGRLWAVAIPFFLVLLWAFVQTLPGISALLAHPLWGEAAQALGRPLAASISLDPEMTRNAILRLASYGGIFWLAVQLGRERTRAREALIAVAVAGTLYAVYGLIVYFAGWERILWLEKWAYPGDLTSTFVNRNAYGAYAGLGVICCMGLFLHALKPPRPSSTRRAFDLAETVMVRAMPYLAGAVVIGTALLLSHSRGAFLCTGLGTVALMMAMVAAGVIRPRLALLLGVVIAGLGFGVLGMSGEGTMERLASIPSQLEDEARPNLYRLTSDAIADAPWTGHGFGAFLPAFRIYRDTTLPAPNVWNFAHNVYLETAMDLGIPGALLLFLSLGLICATCLRGLVRRRRDHVHPAVAVASATLIGAHGTVDFSAQMPAVAATLSLLLGIGFAQSWRTSDDTP